MQRSLEITAANVDPALLDLPWNLPLEEWGDDVVVALPRGISRHIVRFVKLSGRILAVKEIGEEVAYREYNLLRDLEKVDIPTVEATAVITGRTDKNGEPLNCALVTEHLPYSLPYRALFSKRMRTETVLRLIDSLAVLLVRLHINGFYWGDCSLSNTLFRRDAGAFAAYLVDAETGELHEKLTNGQRNYDLDLARTNVIGELMDLQAGALITDDVDTIETGSRIVERYETLWKEITATERLDIKDKWKIEERIKRLNNLGFDVAELIMTTDVDGTSLIIKPKVVDAGHYSRQILRLTGMDVEEQQARHMINDMHTYQVTSGRKDVPVEIVAHAWLDEIFEGTLALVPPELFTKLEPAQIFHEILEHKWYLSEKQGSEVDIFLAAESYVRDILQNRADEREFI